MSKRNKKIKYDSTRMSVRDAIVSTMALTNHIKDIYFHIVDLKNDDLNLFEFCLEAIDNLILRMKQLFALDATILKSDDKDVLYCIDDIHYIHNFMKEWVKNRIILISHTNYLRLQSQLESIQSFFL